MVGPCGGSTVPDMIINFRVSYRGVGRGGNPTPLGNSPPSFTIGNFLNSLQFNSSVFLLKNI